VLDRIQAEFVLGGHKAAAIAGVLNRARVFMVSALPAELVTAGGMQPFADLPTAMQAAFADFGPQAKVAVFPQGGSVLPEVKSLVG